MKGFEQKCPECGREEASHAYCSLCGRRMTDADKFPTPISQRHRETARQNFARARLVPKAAPKP